MAKEVTFMTTPGDISDDKFHNGESRFSVFDREISLVDTVGQNSGDCLW